MPRLAVASLGVLLCSALPAYAQDTAPPASAESRDLDQARQLYKDGLELVRNARWAEALAAFNGSFALRPHALTLYNIGACERALGRYSRALAALKAAVARAGDDQLSPAAIEDTNQYIAELTKILAHLVLSIEPRDAALTVDGGPLVSVTENGQRFYVAGRKPPGLGEPLAEARAEVLLDPGAHVFTVSRRGFADCVINRTFAPGSRQVLLLNLDRLPGTLRISANQAGAAVRVNSFDVGLAPVQVTRPAGSYRVNVGKNGFVAYETAISLRAGEQADIRASLEPERPELYKKWWFWTAAAAVVGGATVATYYATRPEPRQVRPPLEMGGLGWNVKLE